MLRQAVAGQTGTYSCRTSNTALACAGRAMHEDIFESAARKYGQGADELEAATQHLRIAAQHFRDRMCLAGAPTPSPLTAISARDRRSWTRTRSCTPPKPSAEQGFHPKAEDAAVPASALRSRCG